MLERPGDTTYIECTFMTGFMKRDGIENSGIDGKDLENLYPPDEISKFPSCSHLVLIWPTTW